MHSQVGNKRFAAKTKADTTIHFIRPFKIKSFRLLCFPRAIRLTASPDYPNKESNIPSYKATAATVSYTNMHKLRAVHDGVLSYACNGLSSCGYTL